MTAFVLLRIEDDEEAQMLIEDMVEYPHSPLLTPGLENTVYVSWLSPNVPSWWVAALREASDALADSVATIKRVKALATQWEQVGPSYQSLPEGAAQLRQALDEVPL